LIRKDAHISSNTNEKLTTFEVAGRVEQTHKPNSFKLRKWSKMRMHYVRRKLFENDTVAKSSKLKVSQSPPQLKNNFWGDDDDGNN